MSGKQQPVAEAMCPTCGNERQVLVGLNYRPCPRCRRPGWSLPWFLVPSGQSILHPKVRDHDGGQAHTADQI